MSHLAVGLVQHLPEESGQRWAPPGAEEGLEARQLDGGEDRGEEERGGQEPALPPGGEVGELLKHSRCT